MCPSSGESIVSIRHLVYVTLYRWPFGVQVLAGACRCKHLHTKRSSIQSDIYQMSYWYNWFSWWWTHGRPKHVENRNKHTWKRIVRQVGYLKRHTSSHCDIIIQVYKEKQCAFFFGFVLWIGYRQSTERKIQRLFFLSCRDRTNDGNKWSRAVFFPNVLRVESLWLSKITTDSYTLAHVNIVCPDERYPK